MKKFIFALALVVFASAAHADPRDLTYKSIDELPAFSGPPAAGDLEVIYDLSERRFEKKSALDSSSSSVTISTATDVTCATNGKDVINLISAPAAGTSVPITLPIATGSGCSYKFIWVAASGANGTGDIIQVTGDDAFLGSFWMTQDSANTVVAFETAADTDKLTFHSTTGAAQAGAWIEFTDYAADRWHVGSNALVGTGTEATPGATGQRS